MATTQEEGFAAALQYWKGINLSSLQRELDQQGVDIVENQKDSLLSRKKLAEQTRDFKKIPDEEKLQQFKVLLKAYQSEIDAITRRTKFSENSFLSLYRKLAEAPDPCLFLEAALDTASRLTDLQSLDVENARLKEELSDLRGEVGGLRREAAESSGLNGKLVKFESRMEELVAERVAVKEAEMKALLDERIRTYKEHEHDLQRQLNQTLDQLSMLRQSHDSTQAMLIDHTQKYDEEVVAKLAELDIVTIDLERAHVRNTELERQIEVLRAKLESDDGPGSSSAEQSLITERVRDQEIEISKLMKDVESWKDVVAKSEARLGRRVSELSKEVASKTEELESLQRKLKAYDDYDQIKRELDIMKYVEFSTASDDENADTFNATSILEREGKSETLEVMLIEKNRKLQTELTETKIGFEETRSNLKQTTEELEVATLKLNEQTVLIQKLEEDLARLDPAAGIPQLLQHPLSPLAAPPMNPLESIVPTVKDDKSILPIITGQRDRFRQRNAELEEELKAQVSLIEDLKGEVEVLKADNLKLYEKVKFMQVYKEEGLRPGASYVTINNDTAASPFRNDRSALSRQGLFPRTGSDDHSAVTNKYGRMYEESMDPFQKFHRTEETRRYNALNPAEKMTLSLTRLFLANQWSRSFLIIYSLMLHLLVLMTLYRLSLWEECRHDHETPNMANPIDLTIPGADGDGLW